MRSNFSVNTDALRHPPASRAPGASRRLPLRYASMRLILVLFAFFVLYLPAAQSQVSLSPEQRIEAVRAAAIGIWKLQRENGNAAAIKETNECRARLLRTKTTYDEEVEACLVVDYYVSFSTASFYSQLSEEYRQKHGIDPDKIRQDVAKRIQSAYVHFKLSPQQVQEAANLLKQHVFQAVAAAAGVK